MARSRDSSEAMRRRAASRRRSSLRSRGTTRPRRFLNRWPLGSTCEVSKPYFEPELLVFRPRTAWSLHNASTGLAKEMPMSTRLPAIQAVGKLFGMSSEKQKAPLLLPAGDAA